jgi:NADH-quinone oxidoreductase subunit C
MPEQEKGGEANGGSGAEQAPAQPSPEPADRAPATAAAPPGQEEQAGAEQPAAERPARPERPPREAKPPARQPPPPGGIADLIAQALPDLKTEAYQALTHVVVEIARDDIPKAMPVLKDDPGLDLKYLRCLFGVDYLEEGMDVVYQLMSYERGHEVVVKTRLPKDDLRVASVTAVWKGANWHERETRDMFGITFEGHDHLVPLLLPEDMTDHFPLRKDNPLAPIEEWQADLIGGAQEGGAAVEE